MRLVPISIAEAKRYVAHHHRHLRPPRGGLFAVGAEHDGELVGVAIVGRPARGLQNGRTVDVTRLCTDGTRNACSFLYARCRRAARALGYEKVVTYTRQALLPARSWAEASVSRERFDQSEPTPRVRWGAVA